MGNQVRYAFCLQDVHKLLRAGEFGEVFYGEGEYLHDMGDIVTGRGSDHWRIAHEQPQTTLLGGGPHAFDTLRWLMGSITTRSRRKGPSPWALRVVVTFAMLFEITSSFSLCAERPLDPILMAENMLI